MIAESPAFIPTTLDCETHGRNERWIMCAHTSAIRSARTVTGQGPITGEAVCAACQRILDAGRPVPDTLRFVCGACVRARWPVENAS